MAKYEGSYIALLENEPQAVQDIKDICVGLVEVEHFSKAEEMLVAIHKHGLNPTAFLLDLHLDDNEYGADVIPAIREFFPYKPIIIVTSDKSERAFSTLDKADEYIFKGTPKYEFHARYKKAKWNESLRLQTEIFRYGDVTFYRSPRRRMVGPKGSAVLSELELDLIQLLASSQGAVVFRDKLKEKVWDEKKQQVKSEKVTNNAMNRKVKTIREILEKVSDNVWIETHYNQGLSLQQKETVGKSA